MFDGSDRSRHIVFIISSFLNNVSFEDLIAHPVDAPEWSGIAPLRVLSFGSVVEATD